MDDVKSHVTPEDEEDSFETMEYVRESVIPVISFSSFLPPLLPRFVFFVCFAVLIFANVYVVWIDRLSFYLLCFLLNVAEIVAAIPPQAWYVFMVDTIHCPWSSVTLLLRLYRLLSVPDFIISFLLSY